MVIPLSAAHFFISSLINSFPLSILIHFGHFPKCRCIFVKCSLILPVASPLCFMNRTLPCRLQSSTKEIYHFHLPMDSILAGPHTSDIILSPGTSDLFSASFGKGLCACFACMQASHVFDGIVDWSINSPSTIPFWEMRRRVVGDMWPYLRCHWSHDSLGDET